jgi:thioredoxin 1
MNNKLSLTGGGSRHATLESQMSNEIRQVTDASFAADVLKSPLPVLVDYWAEWCGPCKMIAPLLNESASSYAGRLSVAKLNVDENTRIPSQFHVRGIPTLMLFKEGQPVATRVGAMSKSQLTAFIEDNL